MKLTERQLETLARGYRLSPRETEMIGLLFEGHTDNRTLASRMGLSLGSAKVLLHGIYGKTGTSDKAQLLLACLRALHRHLD